MVIDALNYLPDFFLPVAELPDDVDA